MSSGEHTSSDKALFFLQGGGELGALMRTRDWTGSPLGPPSSWPQPLRSVVGLLLTSKFPMFVAWGPELGFLYNDAYAEIAEIWPEIQPMIASALRGEATYRENLPLAMNRGRGYAEQAWFTFSYSPVRDETGAVAGMFCAVAETTAQVRSQARQSFRISFEETIHELEAPTEVMAAAARVLGRSLGVDRVGYGEIDERQDFVTIERDWTGGRLPSLTGRLRLGDFGPALVREALEDRTVCNDLLDVSRISSGRFRAAGHPDGQRHDDARDLGQRDAARRGGTPDGGGNGGGTPDGGNGGHDGGCNNGDHDHSGGGHGGGGHHNGDGCPNNDHDHGGGGGGGGGGGYGGHR